MNSRFSRVSSFGCESGYVRCAIVDCDNNQILKVLSSEYENPVSSVQLFTLSLPKIPLEDIEEYVQNDGIHQIMHSQLLFPFYTSNFLLTFFFTFRRAYIFRKQSGSEFASYQYAVSF